jgi:hypothetical protein
MLSPTMRGIAAAIDEPNVKRVTCMKSARIGWTGGMLSATSGGVPRSQALARSTTRASIRIIPHFT